MDNNLRIKQKDREKLDRQIRVYLARGNKIEVLKSEPDCSYSMKANSGQGLV